MYKKNSKYRIKESINFTSQLLGGDSVYEIKKRKPPVRNTNVLIEDEEQLLLIQYLDLRNIKFTHIPNSTYSEHFSVRNKNKKLGVRGGFPDLVICLKNTLLFIELKRSKKSLSRVSPEQLEWIEVLNTYPHCKAVVCYGFEEAKKVIESIQ
jgi:hypothetical protein